LRIHVEGLIRWAREAADPEELPDGSYRVHLVMPLSAIETALALPQLLPRQ
jgi:hypothetical protein